MATATVAAPNRLLAKPFDLDITIVSAKHLKNVNWRTGDLHPYVIFWLHPDRRLSTKSDASNSTKPVWNERFFLPLPSAPSAAALTLEIFHAIPSNTPKPLVGTLRVSLADLPDPENPNRIRTFDLRRPSGRVNGKIRLKLALRERPLPDYQNTPHPQFYYNNTPPPSYGGMPLPPSPYGSYASLPNPPPPPPPYQYVSQPDPYSVNYQGGCYSHPPPPPPAIERQFSYGGGGGGGGMPPPSPAIERQFSYVGGGGGMPPPSPAIERQFSYVGGGGGVGMPPPPPAIARQFSYVGGGGGGGMPPPPPAIERRFSHVGGGGGGGGGISDPMGSGLSSGGITRGLAGLAIDEGFRYEDGNISDRFETDIGIQKPENYAYYRRVEY